MCLQLSVLIRTTATHHRLLPAATYYTRWPPRCPTLLQIGRPVPCEHTAWCGGTGAYGRNYSSVAEPFDLDATYPPGTLLGRRYLGVADQGHVAVVMYRRAAFYSTCCPPARAAFGVAGWTLCLWMWFIPVIGALLPPVDNFTTKANKRMFAISARWSL